MGSKGAGKTEKLGTHLTGRDPGEQVPLSGIQEWKVRLSTRKSANSLLSQIPPTDHCDYGSDEPPQAWAASCPTDLPDAEMDPWCTCSTRNNETVLFGYAIRHPVTIGLSWVRSTPVQSLDLQARRAVTWSGRRYALGRRIHQDEIRGEGEEAWIAFDLLMNDNTGTGALSRASRFDRLVAAQWVRTCKIARHLDVEPPKRSPVSIKLFLNIYLDAYVTLMNSWH